MFENGPLESLHSVSWYTICCHMPIGHQMYVNILSLSAIITLLSNPENLNIRASNLKYPTQSLTSKNPQLNVHSHKCIHEFG